MNLISNPWNAVFFTRVHRLSSCNPQPLCPRKPGATNKVHRQVDGLEKFLLILVISTNTLFPLLYLFTPLLAFADYRPPAFVPWVGLAAHAARCVALLALACRPRPELVGHLEVRKDHQLITSGVYRRIRHPMYAAIFLWCLAQGLLLPNWLAGWSALVPFSLMYVLRMRREEQMMCDSSATNIANTWDALGDCCRASCRVGPARR